MEGTALETQQVDLESAWTGGRTSKRTLTKGTDFDTVVLGISLGALPYICADLITPSTWQNMVTHVKTVMTQAFQVWLYLSRHVLSSFYTSPP